MFTNWDGDAVRRINVLHVCSNYANDLYYELFHSLEDCGVRNQVFFYTWNGSPLVQSKSEINADRVECYPRFLRYFFSIKEKKVVNCAKSLYSGETYDLIHGHTLFTDGFAAMKLAEVLGIPFIVSVRNTDVNTFFRYRLNLRNVGVKILDRAAKIVFISETYREKVIHDYVPTHLRKSIERKSVVIPNGIDKLFLQLMPNEDTKRVKANPRDITLIQAGVINRNKNQIQTMNACRELIARDWAVTYKVIGEPQDRILVEKLQSEPFVHLYGKLSHAELLEQYRSSDIFVMPSRTETFGLVYAEAISQGLPVIYTRGEGFDGLYPNGTVGYSVAVGDVSGTADAVEMVMANYASIRANCFRARDDFNWDSISQSYYSVYSDSVKTSK